MLNSIQGFANTDVCRTFLCMQRDQYVIVNHNFTQSPDSFQIIDTRNGSLTPLSFSNNRNGDWYFNKSSNNLYYIG